MDYFRKKVKQVTERVDSWGHRFSRDIKEGTCGNSRGQLSRGALVIRFVHRRCLGGRGLGAKHFMTFSQSIKKTKNSVYRKYTYGALCVVQSSMQQIYRRTPMSKCEFNKFHFGIGVFLYIQFVTCTFSKHIFLRTPLDGCFWHRLFSRLSSCIWNGVNLHVVKTKWEAKKFHKNFHDILEKVG